MKKTLLMIVMAIMALTAVAQDEQTFRMGVRVNLGISNVTGEGSKTAFGYGFGWIAEYNLNQKLFFQSGIGLDDIAHKEEGLDGTLNAYYLQIPIHAGYRFGLGERNTIFVQAGPTLGYGIYGSKIQDFYGGETKYFDHAKRFDLGLGARAGVEFGRYQVSAGVNYGVLKVFDGGGHNLSVNLGAAYMF